MPAPSAATLAATPKEGAALGALLDGAGALLDGAGAPLLSAGALLMVLLPAGGVLDAAGADAPGDVTLALGAGSEADAGEPGVVLAVEMVETMERGNETLGCGCGTDVSTVGRLVVLCASAPGAAQIAARATTAENFMVRAESTER